MRLEELLDRSEGRGLRKLGRAELQEIALLYRQAAADLSTLRQDPSGGAYTRFLAQLLRRAHNVIYSGERGSAAAVLRFFTQEYPEIFLRNLNFTVAAFALFLLGLVIGTVVTFHDPDFPLRVLGPQMMKTIERREMWTHSIVAIKPVASSAITTNNLSVAFMMFAGGVAGGLLTAIMALFNGILMGVIASACWMSGMSLKLWSFVAPHGALELPAIFIAGGAGLRLGYGLLFPGFLPRRDALVLAGAEAVRLLLGVVPMLILAGAVEGFFSPTAVPYSLKFLTAAALFLLLLTYLFSPWLRVFEPRAGRALSATGTAR